MEQFNAEEIKLVLKNVDHLTNVESENDPEDDPYQSKYKARKLLEDLKKVVDNELENGSDVVTPDQIILDLDEAGASGGPNTVETAARRKMYIQISLAYIDAKLGANFIDCEENSSGEELLTKSQKTLEEIRNTPEAALVYMYILNQLGILHSARRQYEKARDALNSAEQCYNNYMKQHSETPIRPLDLLFLVENPDAFPSESQRQWLEFESEYTQTLYYLAQVYAKLNETEKSASYCVMTLRRQLDQNQYKPVDWALNSATLSQYYVTEEKFPLALHCLASAMKIYEEAGELTPNYEEEGIYSKYLDMSRCWVKYAISFLGYSLESNMGYSVGEEEDQAESKESMLFDLELTKYEAWMTCKPVKDYAQARLVFLKAQEFVVEAKKFYTIDNCCSDFIELTQDHSALYKNLSLFETDPERKSKMTKRRADLIEPIIKELNPQYYLLVYRQLVFELAEIYQLMVDCKFEILQTTNQFSTHAVNKINSLSEKSIEKYMLYVSTLQDSSGKLPEPLPAGDERPCLIAWFCIARLHYKMIKSDPLEQIASLERALLYYKRVVESCDQNPAYARLLSYELPACREMSVLLPAKLDKLITQANAR